MDEREEVTRELFEPSGDSAVALEIVKEDLDAKAVGVAASVQRRLFLPIGMWIDHGFHLLRLQLLANRVRVIGGISDQRFAVRVFVDDPFGNRRVVLLAWREFDVDRAASLVDEGVNFRGEPTSRTTQCIADDPSFPPAESWWARMTEASRMRPSSSVSSFNASKIFAQCPRCAQFENRL